MLKSLSRACICKELQVNFLLLPLGQWRRGVGGLKKQLPVQISVQRDGVSFSVPIV